METTCRPVQRPASRCLGRGTPRAALPPAGLSLVWLWIPRSSLQFSFVVLSFDIGTVATEIGVAVRLGAIVRALPWLLLVVGVCGYFDASKPLEREILRNVLPLEGNLMRGGPIQRRILASEIWCPVGPGVCASREGRVPYPSWAASAVTERGRWSTLYRVGLIVASVETSSTRIGGSHEYIGPRLPCHKQGVSEEWSVHGGESKFSDSDSPGLGKQDSPGQVLSSAPPSCMSRGPPAHLLRNPRISLNYQPASRSNHRLISSLQNWAVWCTPRSRNHPVRCVHRRRLGF